MEFYIRKCQIECHMCGYASISKNSPDTMILLDFFEHFNIVFQDPKTPFMFKDLTCIQEKVYFMILKPLRLNSHGCRYIVCQENFKKCKNELILKQFSTH